MPSLAASSSASDFGTILWPVRSILLPTNMNGIGVECLPNSRSSCSHSKTCPNWYELTDKSSYRSRARYIKYNDTTMCTVIEATCYCLKSILSCCIPYLKFNTLSFFINRSEFEVNTLLVIKPLISGSMSSLSNSSIIRNYNNTYYCRYKCLHEYVICESNHEMDCVINTSLEFTKKTCKYKQCNHDMTFI